MTVEGALILTFGLLALSVWLDFKNWLFAVTDEEAQRRSRLRAAHKALDRLSEQYDLKPRTDHEDPDEISDLLATELELTRDALERIAEHVQRGEYREALHECERAYELDGNSLPPAVRTFLGRRDAA